MAEPEANLPSPSWWLPVALLLAVLVAYPWTFWAYGSSHLEGQGLDIVHHAVMVHEQARPEGPRDPVLGPMRYYPMTSHWLAAQAVPWCSDSVLAMRYVAWVAILWIYAFQLALLRRFFSWPSAILVLAVIQLASVYLKVGTFNHIMWEGQYNFSRLVGAAGFWGCIYLLCLSPQGLWPMMATWILALTLAGFSFQCHLATGVPALVAFAGFGLMYALERRRWGYLALTASAALTTLVLLRFSTAWQLMASNAHDDGWLPVRYPQFLGVWGIVALVVLFRWGRRTFQPAPGAELSLDCERVLGAALLAAGAMQVLLTVRMVQGTAAPYAVKTLFFLTVPLALFLVALRIRQHAGDQKRSPGSSRLVWCLALVLMISHFATVRRYDLGLHVDIGVPQASSTTRHDRILPVPETLPQVAAHLFREVEFPVDGLYLDPIQPMGSYYLNLVQFRCDHALCSTAFTRLHKEGNEALFTIPGVSQVCLPLSANPDCWESDVTSSADTHFWICRPTTQTKVDRTSLLPQVP